MPLSSILGFQSDKWDNPKESLGAPVGPLQRGRYRCWEAAGKARQAFRELSPEIKDYLEACSIPPTDIVSWSMYMIGHTAETAAPKLLICSTDVKARKYIRKLIKDSKIMEKYPGIGLGDVSALPDRHVIRQLAREAIQALLPPDCDADRAVLAEGSEALLGKRLFIVNPNDFSLRPVTAGPVILQRYQLTVAHVFQHNSEPNLSLDYGAAEDDCDFDGMSDDEGDDGSQDVEITRRGSVSTDGMDSDKDSFTARLDMLSSEEDSDTGSISPSSDYLRIEHGSQRSAEFVSDNTYQHDLDVSLLRFYGRLVLSSLTGSNPSLDYALIEIAPEMVENVKQIPLCGSTVDSLVISTIESDDVDIIAATSECCLAEGRLTATPSYFRFPGHGPFQQVYPVRLDKALADGDCGAAVFGKDDRRFYGHVVAGGPGTGVAYIVPASEISKDVEARLGHGLEPTTRECEKSTKELSQTSAKPAPNAELSESTVKYPFGTITCPSVQWRKSTPERVSDLKSSSVHPYTLDPSEPQQSLTSRSTLQPHTSQLSPVGGRNRSSKLSFSPPDHVSRLTTTPPPTSPSPMSHVLIRRLPLSASEESLRLMMVWSRKLVNIELLPVEESEDPGFCSAVLTFQTLDGAREAKDMLDGRPNIYNNAEMIVEILSKSPLLAPQFPVEITSMNMSTTRGKHPTRFSSSFHSIKSILPQTNSEYLPQKFPELDIGAHNQNLLSLQPCKGNHLTKLSMVSGQTLIANDSHGNGKTSDLLKYPYIESGVTIQRLAAVPQIPISRLAALSLNSNIEPTPGLVSLPPHMSAARGKSSPLLPMDEPGFSMLYPDAHLPYRRRHFPGVNPADENPPCNTLYVGNLPTETSEEELKALFSKQRGYKRLCFRTKHNGPMCFVEFEDVSLATEALHKLYGQSLSNSVRGGIRLSFSKNPLGIRSGPTRGHGSSDVLSGVDGIIPGGLNGFPPVLTPPPSLETGHFNHYGSAASHPAASCSGIANHGWKSPTHSGHIAASPRGVNTPPASFPSLYMTGR